jgi:hypothetical protein
LGGLADPVAGLEAQGDQMVADGSDAHLGSVMSRLVTGYSRAQTSACKSIFHSSGVYVRSVPTS